MKTKKELEEEYKQMNFKMGVFQIRNTINDKIFVEGSTNLNAIWNRHRMQLNFGSHPNSALQSDWKEFGENNFKYEILSELEQNETEIKDYSKEVKVLEEMYLEELKPFDEKGYNRRHNTG
ncbi:MAG: GIY-YIG nuclease family protein [Nitrospirae bacterium]|nr:GIY-YIG nuclease family protein [Nitrospirota bacterium]